MPKDAQFDEGYKARYNNQSVNENPYNDNYDDMKLFAYALSWEQGYYAAADRIEEEENNK